MDSLANAAAWTVGERERPLAASLQMLRFQIVAIAALAAAVFGWLFTGRLGWIAPTAVAADWMLLNFFNRLADVPEDLRNGIPGATLAARHARPLTAGAAAALVLALAVAWPLGPSFLALRLLFHAGGFAYNYRLLPGGRRFKDLFPVKNLSAGALFLLSVLGYPLALLPAGAPLPWAEAAFLAAFFLPMELSYEIIYDLRDVAGDRAEGIPTLPVLFGEAAARRTLHGLLAASAAALVVGTALGVLRFAELVMLAAPLQQWLLLHGPLRRRVTPFATTAITYLGAAQLLSYVAWVALGWPLGPAARPWGPPARVVELSAVPIMAVWLAATRDGRPAARRLAELLALGAGAALGEEICLHFYGAYAYAPGWSLWIDRLPLAVALIWPVVILSGRAVARTLAGSGSGRLPLWTGLVVAFDAFLMEAVAVHAGLWHWTLPGPFGVPLVGPFGWGCYAGAAVWLLQRVRLPLLPALAAALAHAFILAGWWGALRWLPAPEGPAAALATAAALGLLGFAVAFWRRGRTRLPWREAGPRALAASLFLALLGARPAPVLFLLMLGSAVAYLSLLPPWLRGRLAAEERAELPVGS